MNYENCGIKLFLYIKNKIFIVAEICWIEMSEFTNCLEYNLRLLFINYLMCYVELNSLVSCNTKKKLNYTK